MRKYGIWFHENDDSKSDYVGKCQSNWMQFSFAILRRKNQTKSNLKSINKLQHEIVGNLNLNCIKVCIIQLDHICFEKSSSTF